MSIRSQIDAYLVGLRQRTTAFAFGARAASLPVGVSFNLVAESAAVAQAQADEVRRLLEPRGLHCETVPMDLSGSFGAGPSYLRVTLRPLGPLPTQALSRAEFRERHRPGTFAMWWRRFQYVAVAVGLLYVFATQHGAASGSAAGQSVGQCLTGSVDSLPGCIGRAFGLSK